VVVEVVVEVEVVVPPLARFPKKSLRGVTGENEGLASRVISAVDRARL